MDRSQPIITIGAGVSFYISCAPVRRVKNSNDYSSREYEVYMNSEGLQTPALPKWEAGIDEDPTTVVLDSLKQEIGLHGSSAYPLSVSPSRNNLTLYYAVPVSNEDVPTGGGKYWTVSHLLEQFHLDQGTKNMISVLDLWLRERHTIPFVNVDTLFLCSEEGEGIGGQVKAIIENPIHQSHLRPPEDKLVISLNNPVFERTTTQDTTITSNA